jgi:hypothetical protein
MEVWGFANTHVRRQTWEDTQMRLSFIGAAMIVMALVGLAPSSAAAESGRYSRCICHYGYGNVCSVAVSCYDRGGRCRGPCGPRR